MAFAVLLAGLFVTVLLSGLQGVLAGSGGGINASADQAYLLPATTTATARSNSYDIQGVQKVTLFIGSAFDPLDADQATFTFEVSDVPEQSQGAARFGTSTPVTRTTDDVEINSLEIGTTSPFALADSTFGTTTVSLDLRQHGYSFLRVIRTTDTGTRSTSTVSIIRSY